jgi:hypothetical protein
MTQEDGFLDKRGVDVQVIFVGKSTYVSVPIQIKSSKFYQEKHKKFGREHGYNVASLVVDKRLSIILEKIMKILEAAQENKIIHI